MKHVKESEVGKWDSVEITTESLKKEVGLC
jgi:hypothetical protein